MTPLVSEIHKKCMKHGLKGPDYTNARKALMDMAKLYGLITDKADVTTFNGDLKDLIDAHRRVFPQERPTVQ